MMKAMILILVVLFWVGCATVTQVATTVGVGTGVVTQGQKQMIDQTAIKAEKAARPITETEEYYIGRGVAARILSQYNLYNHPETIWYVNHIGKTLAINSARPYTYGRYHFAVLDNDEINAFACPGGIVFITRGMLNLVQNEDELAAVLAHEIGHVTQKHGLKAISKARWTQVVTTLGKEAAREYTGAQLDSLINLFEGTIDDVFQTLVVRGYGRADEYEADKLAIACLEASGYDPIEFQNLLRILEAAQSQESEGIFSTHPNLTDRIAKVRKDLKVAEGSSLPPERIARFKRIAGYWEK
jgi:predicted Zn-dependent protease